MMTRTGKALRALTASVLLLALASILFSYQPHPAQAQQVTLNQVTVHALQQVATEGGPAEFSVRRVGGTVSAQTVQVKTWETEHDDPVYGNPTEQVHEVWFPRFSRDVTLRVAVYNDVRATRTGDLRAEVQASPDNDYTVGSPSLAAIAVLAYTTDMTNPLVSIERETPQLTEGNQGAQNVQFRVHRTKDTSQDTTVLLRVDDPGNRLRGNHWDPLPELPTEFTVPAGQSWAMLTIPLPDDHRDAATRREDVTLIALPSHDYLLAPSSSVVTSDSAEIIDDDEAQELELNFGKDGTNGADAAEGDTLRFTVKRRSTDTDNPARFTVRVETDRSGPDLLLDDWEEDTVTGNLYREYSYELTGSDLEVEQEIAVTQNGETEDDWSYTAKILPLQDYQGNDLDSAVEALYWTVKSGFRETEVEASDSGDSTGTVTLSADVTTVQEGGEVVYTLGRVAGKRAEEITVEVRTWEPNRNSGGNNPSQEFHTVVIPPWEENATLSVYAYVDTDTEPGADRLRARITSVTGGDYERETADFIAVEINDPPSTSAAVTIAVDNTGITEGQSATFTFTRTGGDTAQALTVNIRVDDAHGYLRGNHWDAAPEIPAQVEFGANETTKTITLTALDDERDVPAGAFSVTVLTGTGYHPGNTGLSTTASVIVVDNDVPQELTFQWGWLDFGDSDWESGQSYLECNGTCTNGPAEGTWYYTDGRDFDFYNEVETYWPVHFQVLCRSQDKDRTAHFTVRVEHDRGWLSPRHSDWLTDPVTGKHYKDFPLTLTANQRSVVVRIEVLDNSQDIDWHFSARILPMSDASTGTELDSGVESQYWTFSGQRAREIQASNAGVSLQINLNNPTPRPVPEGDQVQFPVQRKAGYALEPVTVEVRTWEPSRREPGGANPTDQVHTLTFPASPLTSTFIRSRDIDQTQTITVTTEQDSVFEARDMIRAEVVSVSHDVKTSQSMLENRALIRDDDRATVALAASTTSITEGEPVTFTLTRTNNTAEELTVGVTLDDPGGFLEGNFPGEEVTTPSTMEFGAGDATTTLTITPPDDWRDIRDSTLTLTLDTGPEYEITGDSSVTVSVADNDVAPQVSIAFTPQEVEEGTDLVLSITRTGEDKNPIEIPVTAGPVGDQQYMLLRMDPGESLLRHRFRSVDDDYKGLDTHYQASFYPGNPRFWTASGDLTVTGTVLDNDLYTVGIERIRINWDEGRPLRFRVFHNGHTQAAVPVKLLIEEFGNAVEDTLLGERPASIPYGASTLTPVVYTEANDGSDGDAIFTVRLLPGDGYVVDPDNDIAAMIVKDKDPLPVIRFESDRVDIEESAGTGGEIWVELVSALPVPREVSVAWEITGPAAAKDGQDFTASTGRLRFAPGETRKAIPVEILQDNLAEADEQFVVDIRHPLNAVLQDGQTELRAVIEIQDDEPYITMSEPLDTVVEGTDVEFTFNRTGSTAGELTIWVRVIQSSPKNVTTQEEVVFAAGEATATLTVPTEDDNVRRGLYTVRAGMLYPPIIGKPQTYWRDGTLSHTVEVRDNDLPRINLEVEDGRVFEGNPVTFTLIRPDGEDEALTVTLDIEAPASYVSATVPTELTIGAGQKRLEYTIQTVDDAVEEDNAQLTVTIEDGEDYRPGYPNSFTFSIFDNDGGLPGVRVRATNDWVNEGEDVVFRVIRSGDTTEALDARLRLYRLRSRVTAAELADPTLGVTTPVYLVPLDHEEITVNFPVGQHTVSVTRSTADDNVNHGNSTYHAFVLAGQDDPYTAFYEHTDSVWVQDDDRPVVTIGNAPTTDFYGYPGVPYPGVSLDNDSIIVQAALTRTGDSSTLLTVNVQNQPTTRWPAPKQDETGIMSTAIDKKIQPGEATSVINQTGFANVNALGRTRTLFLADPHNCPDDPETCGYGPQYTLGTTQEATVEVRANLMGVRIQANQSSITEGVAAVFTTHRHGGKPGAMTRPLTVKVEVTQKGDYITGTTPETVTFPANHATATLTVATDDDNADEANGRVTVTILEPDGYTDDENAYETGQYFGTPWTIHSAFTMVMDNDEALPEISVSDQEVDEDAGTVTFTVSLAQANNDDPVSFDWSTRDGSATAGSDYQAGSGSHTFAVGETSQEFTVTITDDTAPEDDETFDVALTNLSGAQEGDATGTVTIRDDELDYGVTITDAPATMEEGEEIAITLRRMVGGAPTGAETATDPCYRAGGQAVKCFDPQAAPENTPLTVRLQVTQTGSYITQSLPATATFEPGSRFAVVRISTDDDSTVEANGALTVTVLNGNGYSPEFTGSVQTETVNIQDNDLTLSIADAQVAEGAGATMDFTVSLNAPAPEQVSVTATTADGEATSHANVTATSLGQDFEAKTETITFQTGEQTKTFSVAITDDTFQEKHETFTVELSGQPERVSLAGPVATGTIRNDDDPLVASVTRAYATVSEDHAGAVRFTVELAHPTTTASERNPAAGWRLMAGTATEDVDYTAADGKVFFAVGTTTGLIEVGLIDDNLLEEELETFTVELVASESRLIEISPTGGSFEASIRDDETLSAKITADAEFVAEGQDAVFTVTLTGGVTAEPVRVNFETGGTATAGADYNTPVGNLTFPQGDRSGRSGTLTIAAGEATGTISYPVIRDETEDADETIEVEIFNVSSVSRQAAVPAGDEKASTTILDQDMIVASVRGSPEVNEGGQAAFTVELSSASQDAVSVDWNTADVTATAGTDYTGTSGGTVAISAGSTTATITVQTSQDTLAEGNETFQVILDEARITGSSPPEMLSLGVTAATGTIVDDDAVPDGLTVTVDPNRVTEDAGATDISVTVTLNGSTQFPTDTTVNLEFKNRPGRTNNAVLDEDYTGSTATATIPARQQSVTTTVTITPVDDRYSENNEYARLEASSPAVAGFDHAEVIIEDNDVEPGMVTLTVSPDSVDESANVVALALTGTLEGASVRDVDTVVTVSLTGVTATAGEDYQASGTTLTIPAGEETASLSLNLTVIEDNRHEDDETLRITGTVPGTITVTPATVTIQDNDSAPTSIGLQAGSTPIEEASGAVTVPITATLLGGGTLGTDTVVTLTTVGLTATETEDYAVTFDNSTLTIPAGEFSATVNLTVTPVNDTHHEGNEYIAVRGSNPDLTVSGVRLTIVDDDPAPTTITLSTTETTLEEQYDIHLIALTATLEGDSTLTETVQINPRVTNLTRSETRYSSGVLTRLKIEAGQNAGVTVLAIFDTDDHVDDGDETLEISGIARGADLTVVSTQVVLTDNETAGVSTNRTTLTVPEGERRSYRMSLDSEPTHNVEVSIDVPAGAPFVVSPGSLTFTPRGWRSEQRITVTAKDDPDGDDSTDTITHTVTSDDPLYEGASADDVAVTVTDTVSASVIIDPTSLTISEGNQATYTIRLSIQPSADVTVTITGHAGTDITPDPATLTFTPSNWDTNQTVTLTAAQDGDGVQDSVTLVHTLTGGGYRDVNADDVGVIITDDDTAGVTISESSLNLNEGDDGTYTVVLDTQPAGDVAVTIGGASGTDLSLDVSTLTFTTSNWNTAQTVTVTAEHDGDSANEAQVTLTHTVTSTDDTTYNGISADSVTVDVTDDDEDGVTVSPTSVTVTEGLTAEYTVVLETLPSGNVTVTINDPTDNTDVTADPASLTFTTSNWDTAQTVTVRAAQDDDADDESATITHEVTGYGSVTAADVTVTLEDDAPESLTVSFGQASYTVAEGNTVQVKATLSADPERTVTVPVTHTPQDGAAAADYSGVPANVVFNSGDTEKEFTFSATSDTVDDDEKVKLGFGTLPDGVTAGTISETTVNITDDDVPSVTVSFASATYTVAEGESVTIKVTLSADPERTVTIPLTKDNQDGAAAADYSGVPASVTFNSGDTEKEFTFSATSDSVDDDGESVKLGFGSTLPTGVSEGETDETVVSLTDDDVPAVTVRFEQDTYTAAEGADQTVKLLLSVAPEREVEITLLKANQDGATTDDYSGVPSTVTFSATETGKTFTFSATQDTVDDDGESVKLTISSTLPDGVTRGTPDETTVNITDDDNPAVTVRFEQDTYSVAEGADQTIKLILSAEPERSVQVTILKANQDGATASDYSGVPTTVTFAAAETEKTFNFSATQDTANDDGESVKLTISSTLPTGVTLATPSETTVNITDDDVPAVTVSFGQATYTVTEGQNVSVKVTLSADPERTVTIPLTKDNQDGASNPDYSVPGTVVFNSGDTEKEVTFSATDDNVDDDGESVKLGFGSPLPAGMSEGSTDETTVSITDNDTAGLTVSSTSFNVQEGGTTDFTVKLGTQPTHNVTVTVESGDTAAATVSTSSLTFTASNWDTEQTVTVSGIEDDDADGKLVTITLTAASTDTDYDEMSSSLTATVVDDDVASIVADPTSMTVTEDGTGQFTVKLATKPSGGVNVTVESGDTAATVSESLLSFTTSNWNTTQAVTVSGVDDSDTGNESVTVTLTAASTDENYGGKTGSVTVTVTDDDTPNVVLDPTSLTVGEAGTNTFTVKLGTLPTADVTVSVTSDDTGAATVSPTPMTFTPDNWNTTQTVTVHGVQDSDTNDESPTATVTGNGGGYVNVSGTVSVTVTDDDEIPVNVSFGSATYSATEGGTVVVKVQLDQDPERTVTIPLTKTNQDGATDSDYSGVATSVTFNSGDTEKDFTFSATDDTVDDDGESVKLGFGTLPTDVSAGTPNESVVAIVDNDAPQITASFGAATYTVTEGQTTSITITLSAAPERVVTIPLTHTHQDGASNPDYAGNLPTGIIFLANDTQKSFNLTAIDDSDDDDGESVKLGFGATLPAGISTGTHAETTVNITDNDDPAVTATFENATYTATEGTAVNVKVTLSADPERTVTLPIQITNQGGATSADYTGVPASVTFMSEDTQKSFNFTASDDSADDDGESVRLDFGTLPTGVSGGTNTHTVISITDNDDPQVTVKFEQATYTATEGNTVTINVQLSADPERAVTIPITATGQNGGSSADHSGVPQTLTFNSGQTQRAILFTAVDDSIDDDGEGIQLGFGTLPSGVSGGSTTQTTVNITDNDDPAVTASFGAATYTVAEGGTVTVAVNLSADPERTVSVSVNTTHQGGATNADYSGPPTTLEFGTGETQKTLEFEATQDTVDDDDESVKLTFGNMSTGVSAGTPNESVVSITDDDDPQVNVSFSAATYTAPEGGTVTIAVQLDQAPERSLTIPITKTNQDGATDSDYSGVPASLSFTATDTEKTFTFSATDDSANDDGESVKLGFGTLPSRVSAGTNSEATVSITDGDVPTVTVSYENASYSVDEGDDTTIKVVLSADPERTVTIPVTKTNQDGASNSDYSGVPTSVVFNSGDTEKEFTFSATDDSTDDDGEKVNLGFGTLPAGVNPGTNSTTTVNLNDNDDPSVTVGFGQATYTVAEGNDATVSVTLSADPERTVVVPITHDGQDGATAADYSGVPANVTFNSGDTEKQFTFSATSDSVDDDGESVKLGLGTTLPAGVSAGSVNEATVNITDDDHPAITVSYGQASHTVEEGQTTEVTVSLSAAPERLVTIPITSTPQNGAVSQDYSGVPSSIIFLAAESEKNFDLRATNDSLDDDGESVKLGFGESLPDGVTTGTHAETVVSITDNDDPQITVGFQNATYSVDEGDSINITMTVSADPERTARMPLEVTNQQGATDDDHSLIPEAVTFNAGQTSRTFSFRADEDTTDDDGEKVRISLGTLPSGVTAGTTAETVVSINDDDDPAVTASFGAATYSAEEGGSVEITVTLSAAPERAVAVSITKANQGGATDADYSGVPASVTFSAQETNKSFTFNATDDSVDDDGESVKLTLTSLPAGVSTGSHGETTVNITDGDVPTVNVQFEQSSYTAAEGGSVQVKIKLSADPERTVTVPLTVQNQDGASNADHSGIPADVTFNSEDTEKTFTFEATQDSTDDDGESVKITFGTLPAGVNAGTNNETVVSITDDDVPSVTVSYEQSTYTVAEGASVTVKTVLTAAPERTVTIPITKTHQDGATASDYSGVPTSVTFQSTETEKTFDFSATSDSDDDDGESVKLGFGNSLPTGVSAGSTDETAVSITDDDVPSVTVSFGSASHSANEGTSVTINVNLSADPERTVTIPIEDEGQDGATSGDYSGVPESVVFNSEETSKSFIFTATQDEVDDDGESVKISFGTLPSSVSAGSPNETVINIGDDDYPAVTLTFGEASYTVSEGGEATVALKLDVAPERTVTVPITVSNQDGATASDYSGIPASVVFGNNDTEKSFILSATQDDVNDDGESVKLTFGSPLLAGVSEGSQNETVVSITDDDAAGFNLSKTSVSASESGTDTFTVKLNSQPTASVTISITSDDTGAATASPTPLTFTTTNWGTVQTVTISGVQDTDTSDESVDITVSAVSTDSDYQGLSRTVSATITDDDTPGLATSPGSLTLDEGEDDTFTVKLTTQPTADVTVSVTSTDTGAATVDTASLTFNSSNWNDAQTVTVDAEEDQDAGDESLNVNLNATSADAGYNGRTGSVAVTVDDDDGPAVSVQFGNSSYSVSEGSTVTVTVTLSADPERTVSVNLLRLNLNGATSDDYSGVPASVTFNAGETEKSFTFSATQDAVTDAGEKVSLTLGTLPPGVSFGSITQAVVTILDVATQNSVTVNFQAPDYMVVEGGRVDVTVTLSQAPGSQVTIPITTSEQGGVTSSDYSSVPTSITFGASDTAKSFTFTATQDTEDDDGESVRLGFGTLPSGTQAGTVTETVVSINDDDHPQVTVSFGNSSYNVEEGSSVDVLVKLDADPERTVAVPIETSHLDGADASDYSGVPASVVFQSGQTERTIVFSATADDLEETTEQVNLGFGTLPEGVSQGAPATAAVYITNVTVEPALSQYPPDNGKRVILDYVGEIANVGDSQFWRLKLDLNRMYLFELFGERGGTDAMGQDMSDSSLTLRGPRLMALWNDEKTMMLQSSQTGNRVYIASGRTISGWHQVEITGNGNTGTYRIKIRVNNVCWMSGGQAHYPWFGGPDGYVLDTPADSNTQKYIDTTHHKEEDFLGDNWEWYWDGDPDVDWTRTTLSAGQTYKVEAWTAKEYLAKDQVTDMRIVAVYDPDGNLMEGTAGTETGEHVSVAFTAAQSGTHHLAFGSGTADRTGMYHYHIREVADEDENDGNGARSNDEQQDGQGDRQGKSDDPGNKEGKSDDPGSKERKSNDPDPDGEQQSVEKDESAEEKNSPATGAPKVTGTPQVGETLTADTTVIEDADGLENAEFSYQWTSDGTDIEDATGQTLTLTDSEEGKVVRVRVSFTDDQGNTEELLSPPTAPVEPAPTAPTAPMDLSLSTAAPGELRATWNAPDDDGGSEITSYTLQWKETSGDWDSPDQVSEVSVTGTGHTIAGLTGGTGYSARVVATNDVGDSPPSTEARGTPQTLEPPPAPTNLLATVNSDGSITLTWEAPDDDTITGYQILRRRPQTGEDTLLIHVGNTGSTGTSYTDTETTAGTRHVYRVKAINGAGAGSQSNFARATP